MTCSIFPRLKPERWKWRWRKRKPGGYYPLGNVNDGWTGERQTDPAEAEPVARSTFAHFGSMKIRQVLINLLSNAAKFTERGSITIDAEPFPDYLARRR
jgi:hypothetical protein